MKCITTICLATLVLLSQRLSSQSLSLIKDLNTKPLSISFINSTGTQWQPSNTLIYFDGTDNKGQTLWRTDGTAEGTHSLSSPPIFSNYRIAFGDHSLLFCAADLFTGYELWISDGTEVGTHLVKDIFKGKESSYPGNFINVNGTVFFKAFTPAYGEELYKTDGTKQGTVLVKDLEPGPNYSSPIYKFDSPGVDAGALNGKLIFSASTTQTGRELFISDGTSSGTMLLKDLYVSAPESDPHSFVNLNGALYFLADKYDSVFLWKTDGTTAGTVQIAYLPADHLVASNGKIYCSATDNLHGSELWISDGTTAGTHLLLDINPGAASSFFYYTEIFPIPETGEVYFSVNDGTHGTEPWHSDGTVGGTKLLKNIISGSASSSTSYFNFVNNKVVFVQDFPTAIWGTDGTTAGTQEISDDFIGYAISETAPLNNKIYLNNQTALYSTDGTTAGTVKLDIENNETQSSGPFKMIKLNQAQYIFSSSDTVVTHENIYVSDGTEEGTTLIKKQTASQQSIYTFATSVNGLAFYKADFGIVKELWVSDGTTTGTKKIAGVNPEFSNADKDFAVLNNILYFRVYTGSEYELWRSDGTEAGTYQVKEIGPSVDDAVDNLTVFNGFLYFQGQENSATGKELFRSDGTSSGTTLFLDINPGTASSTPANFREFNGKLYFSATAAATGNEMYVTDGTATGTQLFDDIEAGSQGSNPIKFTPVNDDLFFVTNITNEGGQLWKTNGTVTGTSIVKEDLNPQQGGINSPTEAGGLLYFTIYDGLYKSDGTASGTILIQNFPDTYNPSQLSNVDGVLYFQVNDYLDVDNIWRTDGTACHTEQLDLSADVYDHADIVLIDSNTLFLDLNSLQYGKEIFKYVTAPISSIEVCNGIDDDCNGIVDDNALMASITPSGTLDVCDGVLVILNASPVGDDLSYAWYYNGTLINNATTSSLASSTLSGDVQVVVSSSFGCVDTSAVTSVDRIPLPAAKITPQGSLDICAAGFVKLKANNGIGYSYQWMLANTEIFGATNKTYNASQPGNYKVEVTNVNGCSKTSKKIMVFTSCKETGPTWIAENSIVAYPNPFHDVTHLDLSKLNWSEDQVEIRITDLFGKIFFQKFFSNQTEIETGDELPDGFYLLEVKGKSQRSVISIVKE